MALEALEKQIHLSSLPLKITYSGGQELLAGPENIFIEIAFWPLPLLFAPVYCFRFFGIHLISTGPQKACANLPHVSWIFKRDFCQIKRVISFAPFLSPFFTTVKLLNGFFREFLGFFTTGISFHLVPWKVAQCLRPRRPPSWPVAGAPSAPGHESINQLRLYQSTYGWYMVNIWLIYG